MPDASPEQGSPDQQLNREQQRIDALDGMQDSAIGGKSAAESAQELTDLYLRRTNTLQGKIRDARRVAEALRTARSENWQTLEATCTEVETGLLQLLRSVDGNTVASKTKEFQAGIDAFIQRMDTGGAENPKLEEIRSKREKGIDALAALDKTLQDQKLRLTREIEGLARNTKE